MKMCKVGCALKKYSVGEKFLRLASKAVVTTKTHSPELYLAAGIVSGVAAAIMLAKAYKKQEETVEPIKEAIAIERAIIDDHEVNGNPKALSSLYGELAVEYIKLYGPAVTTGALAVASILASHGVMRGRNQMLFAAYKSLESGFSQYRQRVVQEYGQDADERIWLGVQKGTVTRQTLLEDGTAKDVKSKENVTGEKPSPLMYSRMFDGEARDFTPDYAYNRFILGSKEQNFTDILRIRGHVTLNEVYRELGYKETPEGAIVGWAMSAPGDDFVDFGLHKGVNTNPDDPRAILDFNVNGVIYEYIGG